MPRTSRLQPSPTTRQPADTTAPSPTTSTVNGSTLVINFNEALDPASTPAGSAFDVQVNASADTVNNVSLSGTTATLTLTTPVTNGQTVTVAYTKPGSPPWLQDVATNPTATFGPNPVTNNTPPADTTAPSPTSATVNGSTLLINFDEALDGTSTPATSAFDVQVNTTNRAVNNVSLSGSAATLTLATPVTNGQTVTVTYTKPGSAPWLRDVAGNPTATFTALGVTNNTPPSTRRRRHDDGGREWHDAGDQLRRSPGRRLGARGSAFNVQVAGSPRTVNTVGRPRAQPRR